MITVRDINTKVVSAKAYIKGEVGDYDKSLK